jgi:hypothetical protein
MFILYIYFQSPSSSKTLLGLCVVDALWYRSEVGGGGVGGGG